MKRVWRIAVLSLLTSCTLSLTAAKNSEVFLLPVDVRVGDQQIPQGQYTVTWTRPAAGQLRLRLTAGGKEPITVSARLISEKHPTVGITTFEENGVTYLQDFHTADETFIVPGTPSAPK